MMNRGGSHTLLKMCRYYLIGYAVLSLINLLIVYGQLINEIPISHLFSSYVDRVASLHQDVPMSMVIAFAVWFIIISPMAGIGLILICLLFSRSGDKWHMIAFGGIAALISLTFGHVLSIV